MSPVSRVRWPASAAQPIRSWHAYADGNAAQSNLVNEVWPPGAIVCLSHDANWLFLWFPGEDGSTTYPLMRRIIWIRHPIGGAPEVGWHAHLTDYRRVRSGASFDRATLFVGAIADQFAHIQDEEQSIRSFQIDDRAGFMIPTQSEESVVVWTSTGFAEAAEVPRGPNLVPCKESRATGRRIV